MMTVARISVLLAAVLASAFENPLKDGLPVALHPSVDLLMDVLTAMDRGLDFMSTQTDLLNLDGVIGLRMVDDQLQVFLDHHGTSLFDNSTAKIHLLTYLNNLRWKAKSAADIAIPKVSIAQPKYFHTLGVLLKDGQWALDFPTRSLPNIVSKGKPISKKKVMVPLLEGYSDACIHELTGSSAMSEIKCNVSDTCWKLMTSPGYKGYALTHQLLYLQIGEMSGCSEQLERMASKYGQSNISSMEESYCNKILSEAEKIEMRGYPQSRQDLLMEQIVLCGILGYREFLNEDWLKEILTWQEPVGCYSRPEFEGLRVKREDAKLQGSCSAHKTAVALGALVSSARFLLEAMIDGATFM